MPELPEVETVKNDLLTRIKNKKILKISKDKSKLIKNSFAFFKKELEKASFLSVERIGKLLIFKFLNSSKKEKYLLVHLKMTGQLIYCDKNNFIAGGHINSRAEEKSIAKQEKNVFCKKGKYTHIIFEFEDGAKLFYNDLRQFGYLKIVDKKELVEVKSKFGIEPLQKNFTWENFQKIVKNKKTNIKAFLLNQKNIAGIGNIYADKILFKAGVFPKRNLQTLSREELKNIFLATKSIIAKAIKKRGTTFSDYRDARGKPGGFRACLMVYGREGKLCKKCKKGIIKKIKVAGRGTRYCPVCQK